MNHIKLHPSNINNQKHPINERKKRIKSALELVLIHSDLRTFVYVCVCVCVCLNKDFSLRKFSKINSVVVVFEF